MPQSGQIPLAPQQPRGRLARRAARPRSLTALCWKNDFKAVCREAANTKSCPNKPEADLRAERRAHEPNCSVLKN